MDFSNIRYILSPMASFTDAAFRLLCKRYGADYVVTEFVSAEAVVRDNWKTEEMTFISEEERPCAIQIFGPYPEVMVKAAQKLEKKADVIDVNFGCPAPKITKKCGGAALLDNPQTIKEILEELVSTIKKPVTAKMRLGTTTKENAVEIAKVIEKTGVKALAVHARTLRQGYAGQADWDKIKEIKQAISIPLFGNGDVVNYSSAKKMFEYTKCDAVLIGRGALGNPFVFSQCKKENDFEITPEMRIKAFQDYIKIVDEKNIRRNSGDIKGQALQFIKGIQGARKLRDKVCSAKTREEIVDILVNWKL